jgi:diguanylate cyclase (GGDEF)-like protein
MSLSETPLPKMQDRTVPGLLVAATCVILFTLGAGVLLHQTTHRLIDAQDWLVHTDEVQAGLQGIRFRIDRLDALEDLYILNRHLDTLKDAQNLALATESAAIHVAGLVSDNRAQDGNANRLKECAHELALAAMALAGQTGPVPIIAQHNCRETVLAMQEQERLLAEMRRKATEDSRMTLAVASLSLAAFFIFSVIVMFFFLVRDALLRRKAQQDLAVSNGQLASTIQVLEEHAAEMKLLRNARDQLQICVSGKETYDVAGHFFSQLLPGTSGALCMIDSSRRLIEPRSTWGSAKIPEVFAMDDCCGMRSGQERWRTPEGSLLHCNHFRGDPPEYYVCMPLMAQGDTLGFLHVECPTTESIEGVEHHLAPLRDLLQLASMTVAQLNLRTKLEHQSIRDSLTGLFNRHFMEIALEREVRRASRRNSSLAVFMIDADYFKRFNDTFGHSAGDSMLRAVAERFLSAVRGEDIVCRYGGEEFIVILPDINAEDAAMRAEQIRAGVSSIRVTDRGQPLDGVTVSIGVAIYPHDGRAVEELLEASDRSLYQAKNRGRNQVVFSSDAAGLAGNDAESSPVIVLPAVEV